ncbi:MAG TPA: cobyric acid synthase, partial [Nitrospira sp.]|nr:cobyric acid synthase [Nitrospira sp.]
RTDRAGLRPSFQLVRRKTSLDGSTAIVRDEECLDGAVGHDGLVWGTYVHGLFDQPDFRRAWLNRLRSRKGLPAVSLEESQRVNDTRLNAMDRWADHVDRHLDLAPVLSWLR